MSEHKKYWIISTCFGVVFFIQACAPILTPTATPILTPTATPWVKQDILIEMAPGDGLSIWTDNAEADMVKVDQVEGVLETLLMRERHMIYARIDHRYDKVLVAEEIMDALSLAAY